MREKIDREIRVKVQRSLHEKFRVKAEKNLKTVSIVIRELMKEYVDEPPKRVETTQAPPFGPFSKKSRKFG